MRARAALAALFFFGFLALCGIDELHGTTCKLGQTYDSFLVLADHVGKLHFDQNTNSLIGRAQSIEFRCLDRFRYCRVKIQLSLGSRPPFRLAF